MKFFNTLLTCADFLGYTPNIFFKGKTKFQTAFGGLFSIIIFIIIVLTTIGFGEDIYLRQKPSISLNNDVTVPLLAADSKLILGYRIDGDGGAGK